MLEIFLICDLDLFNKEKCLTKCDEIRNRFIQRRNKKDLVKYFNFFLVNRCLDFSISNSSCLSDYESQELKKNHAV